MDITGADSHELIRVHGARLHNLKDVSVELPKRRLTVFTPADLVSAGSALTGQHLAAYVGACPRLPYGLISSAEAKAAEGP